MTFLAAILERINIFKLCVHRRTGNQISVSLTINTAWPTLKGQNPFEDLNQWPTVFKTLYNICSRLFICEMEIQFVPTFYAFLFSRNLFRNYIVAPVIIQFRIIIVDVSMTFKMFFKLMHADTKVQGNSLPFLLTRCFSMEITLNVSCFFLNKVKF